MKLVILDGFAANPGDIDSEALRQLRTPDGQPVEVEIFDRTPPELTAQRAADAQLVLTNKTVLDAATIGQLPQLHYIGVLATGYNVVDTAAARARGIVVTNIPAYSTESVAQMVFAHLLNITQHVGAHSDAVHAGRWQTADDFCFWDYPLTELSGQTFGIVGLGHTGQATARLARAFGMRVLAMTSKSAQATAAMGIKKAASMEALFRASDVLSLHCPLTAETRHLIRRETLQWLRPTAILINTGRGPLICEEDLADALRHGRLYAAGLDVLTQEPPRQGSPLIGLKNCYITPHIAWATQQARARLWQIALQNIQAFLAGKPVNTV